MTNKEAIDKIAKILKAPENWEFSEMGDSMADSVQHAVGIRVNTMANKILSEIESLGYVKIAEDQSLPAPSIFLPSEDNPESRRIARYYYLVAQRSMLIPDKNGCVWVKVEKELK